MRKSTVWILLALAVIAIVAFTLAFLNIQNANDIPGVPDPAWRTYTDETLGFRVLYPSAYALNEDHVYTTLDTEIEGVSFKVPQSLTRGTNLSNDTYFAIETVHASSTCSARTFLPSATSDVTIREGDMRYSFASTSDAGAGNFYEEHVYAIQGSEPCVAFRYFIHSTNVGNYEPGTVIEFDRRSLMSVFDAVRGSYQEAQEEASVTE